MPSLLLFRLPRQKQTVYILGCKIQKANQEKIIYKSLTSYCINEGRKPPLRLIYEANSWQNQTSTEINRKANNGHQLIL